MGIYRLYITINIFKNGFVTKIFKLNTNSYTLKVQILVTVLVK